MSRIRVNPRAGASWLVLFALAAAGCQSDPNACKDIASGSIPEPAGTKLCEWQHAERARADQEYFVIYHYEWAAEPTTLTPNGREHVDCLADRMAQSACPIVIEASDDERLDAHRREAVMKELGEKGLAVGMNRVVVGHSQAEGLYGQEAPGIAASMLTNQSGGGGGGGASGSISGGGASGSISGGGGGGIY